MSLSLINSGLVQFRLRTNRLLILAWFCARLDMFLWSSVTRSSLIGFPAVDFDRSVALLSFLSFYLIYRPYISIPIYLPLN